MAQRGVDAWISSLLDTHASPSVSLEPAKELKTPVTSGPTSSESLENVNQLSLFSKTSKATFQKDFVKSSKASWNWGTAVNGEFIPQPKPVLPIGGTEFSSWRTPSVEEVGPRLETLSTIDGGPLEAGKRIYRTTPNGERVNQTVTLGLQAEKVWMTPTTRDHKDGTNPSPKAPTNDLLGRQDPRVTGAMSPKNSGLRLNPLFVEWLMGFPPGWISLEPSAMPLSPSKQPSPSEISKGGCSDD